MNLINRINMSKTEQNNYNEVFKLEQKYFEQYKQQPTLEQWEQFLIDNLKQ